MIRFKLGTLLEYISYSCVFSQDDTCGGTYTSHNVSREKVLNRIYNLYNMYVRLICLHFCRKVTDNSKRRAYFQLVSFERGMAKLYLKKIGCFVPILSFTCNFKVQANDTRGDKKERRERERE